MENDGLVGEASSKRVHTFDSLKQDYLNLVREQNEINGKLEKCKTIMNAVQNDDLDAYVQSLKANASTKIDSVTRTKLKRRLLDINNDLKSVEKLIKLAKPPSFDLVKWKNDVQNMRFDEKPVSAMKIESEIASTKPIIEREVLPQPIKPVEPRTETPVPTPPVKKKPTVAVVNQQKPPKNEDDDEDDDESERKFKDYKYPTDDQDYSWWMPPQGITSFSQFTSNACSRFIIFFKDQSGDGKTKLNEKYGY
jgi:hypothetical protein